MRSKTKLEDNLRLQVRERKGRERLHAAQQEALPEAPWSSVTGLRLDVP